MKSFCVLLLLFIANTNLSWSQRATGYGPIHNEYQLAYASKNKVYYVINAKGGIVSPISELVLSTSNIIENIKKSNIPDKDLIARVLQMQGNYENTVKEVMSLSLNNNEMARIVLQEAERCLKDKFSESELMKLKKKKK